MSDSMQARDNIVGPVDIGWSVTTLKQYYDAQLADRQRQHERLVVFIDTMLAVNERERQAIRTHYESILVEYDRRYQARFVASEIAVATSFSAQEKAINAALASAQAAVNKADIANEKRFDGVNEFRAQLGDQQRTLMPRAEVEALLRAINEKSDSLTSRMDRHDATGNGQQQVWGYVVAGVGVAVGIAGIVIGIVK